MESLLEDMEEVVAPDLSAEAPDWCTSCQALKQQLTQVREEQVQNFQKLKQKIISTDLLIKKYKSKCDHDIQCKKTDEAIKRGDRFQRQTEILETQLKAALLDTEPLRQNKISLEKQLSERTCEVQTLSDRILSLEGVNRQYDNLTRANSVDLERLQAERKEHVARIKCLESGKLEKGEAKEYKSEISSLKKEKTTLMKVNHRLEKKLCAAMAKIELMRNNQKSSPRRRRHTGSGCSSSPIKSPGVMWSPKIFKPSPKARAQPRSMSDRNSSSQATDILGDPVDKKPVSEMESSSSDDSNDDQTSLLSFKWTLSPVAPCISPLPPTPLCVDINKIHRAVSPQSDDDDVSDMADQLEQQLLQMDDGPQQLESLELGAKSEASQIENSCDVPISAMDNTVKHISDDAVPTVGIEIVEQYGTVSLVQVCFSEETVLDRAPVDQLAEHNRDTEKHVLTEHRNTQKVVDDSLVNTETSNHVKQESTETSNHVKQETIGHSYTVNMSEKCSETATKPSSFGVTKQEDNMFKEANGKTNAPMSTGNNVHTIEETSLIENVLTDTSDKHVQSDHIKAEENDEHLLNHQDGDQDNEYTGLDFGDNEDISKDARQMNKDHDCKLKVDRTVMKDIVDIQIWKEDQVETIQELKLPPVTSCLNRHEVEFNTKSVTKLYQNRGIEKKDNLLSKESIYPKGINKKGGKEMQFGSMTSCKITQGINLSKGSSNTLEKLENCTEKTDFDFIEGYNIVSRSVKANNSPKALDKNVKKKLRKNKTKNFFRNVNMWIMIVLKVPKKLRERKKCWNVKWYLLLNYVNLVGSVLSSL